jgi:hypothetical protein
MAPGSGRISPAGGGPRPDSPFANGTKWHPHLSSRLTYPVECSPSTWTFFLEYVERATRIELAFSAWEPKRRPLCYQRRFANMWLILGFYHTIVIH